MAADLQGFVQSDEKGLELTRRLAEARTNSKQWADVADYVRDELVDHTKELATAQGIDEPKGLTAAAGVKAMSMTTSVRNTYDYKQAMEDHPEIDWEKYRRVSSSTQVRTSNV